MDPLLERFSENGLYLKNSTPDSENQANLVSELGSKRCQRRFQHRSMASGFRKYRSNNNNLIIHIALFSYSFIALYNDNVKK